MQAKITSSTIKRLTPEPKAYEVVDTELKGFLLRIQPTGRKTFYYSYRTAAGSRKRIKIGALGPALTVAQARDKATICAGKVSDGVDVQGEKAAGKSAAKEALHSTLERFLFDQYHPWAVANRKSGQQTVDQVTRAFKPWLKLAMQDIHIKRVERWRTARLQSGTKPSSINRLVHALRGVMTKAVEWDVIAEHPLAKLKPLAIDAGINARYLSVAEEERLWAALAARDAELKAARERGNAFRSERGYALLPDMSKCTYSDRLAPLIIMSLKTGMRRGELFDLEWPDVDLRRKVVTVRGEIAKSSKTRHIPLSPTALAAMKNWKKQSTDRTGRVFPADDGGRLDNVKRSWASLLKAADIQQFRWHDMRHDFASKLVMQGVPLNTVRELCGHADLNTTLRYAHLAPDHKADTIALIG